MTLERKQSSVEHFMRQLISFGVVLALIVIILGAYTRLSDAGLGCPDWPGCYGHYTVPDKVDHLVYDRALESGKAWKEMIHRYVAGTLGIVILVIFILSLIKKTTLKRSLLLPSLLLVVVVFQALLGMWTVTLKLSPVVVSAHLLGGLATLSLLWLLLLQYRSIESPATEVSNGLKLAAGFGLLLVIGQIFLGGWTSSNYAALACGSTFPTCLGQWWPEMDFTEAFLFLHEPGKNYEFGTLSAAARSAIQMTHRIGALIVFTYLIILAIGLIKRAPFKKVASFILLLLFTQVSLGIMNVMLGLPLSIAVLHNLVAALLLLTLIALNYKAYRSA